MSRRYTLSAVTVDGQANSIGIEVRCASTFNKWARDLRRQIIVPPFKFQWTEYPGVAKYYHLFGSFCPEHRQDGIHVVVKLCLEDSYYNPEYTLAEFYRMITKGSRPTLGWCVAVKV